MEIIVKPEVLVKIKKPHQLKDIDLSNKNNLVKPGEMGIGFAVDCEVKKLKQKYVVSLTGIKVFKKAVQKFLTAMVEKLLERTPLAPSLLQSACVFDPQNVLQMSKEKAFDLFKSLLTNIQLNILSPNCCDQALAEFKSCLDVKIEGIKFTSFLFSQK